MSHDTTLGYKHPKQCHEASQSARSMKIEHLVRNMRIALFFSQEANAYLGIRAF